MLDNQNNINLNPEHYAVMANDIVRGRQSMTLQAARLIRLVIAQVVKEQDDLRTYTCNIANLADFLGIPRNNMYRDIVSICETLHKSVVYVATGNPKHPWEMLTWLSLSKYDGNGNLTLRLSEDIKPYVLELEKYFTQYQLKNVLQFSSFYALRIYELIKCFDGKQRGSKDLVEFTVQELREAVDCIDRYKLFADFKRRVLDIAVGEINEKSDIEIVPEYTKEGRAIKKVRFYVSINKNPNNKNSPIYKYQK